MVGADTGTLRIGSERPEMERFVESNLVNQAVFTSTYSPSSSSPPALRLPTRTPDTGLAPAQAMHGLQTTSSSKGFMKEQSNQLGLGLTISLPGSLAALYVSIDSGCALELQDRRCGKRDDRVLKPHQRLILRKHPPR
ncbi:uncharacterized protein BDR25DRAFT_354732 [Lindgomyces ingoldianus]|uniref:Uncharacterized protein n=1 Tax=Lindgomyces ingoldianus TaxID=673940 RepID=A0ACB6QWT7_9PLEO|nr:uncharacterized protein BDR25DRAFT_354732 [Lindgomyces ingoldianus]KAF2471478.1 hypothetical protein BDR25DRAFT_354732 [Lindgomyces ingoldianus]